MASSISKFETISRHQASLRQTPAVIECLVNVLNYIKSVLDDDATQTLYQMIEHHIETEGSDGITAHYLNIELLTSQIIAALRNAFIAAGVYSNPSVTESGMKEFFSTARNPSWPVDNEVWSIQYQSIYDSIPTDVLDFLKWLLSNPAIYTDSIPVNFDAITTGLTLRLAQEWFEKNHNDSLSAHANGLSDELNTLMMMCKVLPSYCFTPANFMLSLYELINDTDYNAIMDIVTARLLASGSPVVIDYATSIDSTQLIPPPTYMESVNILEAFFRYAYPQEPVTDGATLIQLNTLSIDALGSGGTISYDNYDTFLADYGETDGRLIGKKFLNYYSDHLTFVLSDSMTPDYQTTLTNLRSNVNTNYSKVYNVFTVLGRNNLSVSLSANIEKLATSRTLDLINLVGLSKSTFCLCLIPKPDVYGNLTNQLVLSFDNYNTAFTTVLIDKISSGELVKFRMAVSMSKTMIKVYYTVNGNYSKFEFPNAGRMYDVESFFLFVPPRVAEYKKNTIRLTDLRLFGKDIDDDDAIGLVAGFRHQ